MNNLLAVTADITANYRNKALFSELFEGFIFFLAVIVLMMILIFTIPRYKKNPTARRRSVIKGLNIALTIVGSLFLLEKLDIFSFLFNPYDYITGNVHSALNLADSGARTAYIAMYVLYIIVIIVSVIVCVWGYRVLLDKSLTQAAFRVNNVIAPQNPNFKACAVCGTVSSQFATACPKCAATEFVSAQAQNVAPQPLPKPLNICESCNAENPENAAFCHNCGKRLGSDN
ncbi:MAG: zinc ribbon domain-containing protein [Ruminiclostridium sp.]|nr:zinc ribbon domain-containing protein [Ruminiclostridium sp.]